MLKEVILIAAVIAIAAASTLSRSVVVDSAECQYENELWGGDDPRAIYFCVDGVVYQDACRTNYYFVRNATVSGCIPAARMNPNCVSANAASTIVCEGENLQQPQPSTNPGQFFLCPGANESPVLLSCNDGQGFINYEGYLGCFDWTTWREVRGCPA